jgi:hypothetical protein
MTFEKKPEGLAPYLVTSDSYSFNEVVDSACEKLMDQQIKYSIRRIQKMEEKLTDLEKELDIFLFQRDK